MGIFLDKSFITLFLNYPFLKNVSWMQLSEIKSKRNFLIFSSFNLKEVKVSSKSPIQSETNLSALLITAFFSCRSLKKLILKFQKHKNFSTSWNKTCTHTLHVGGSLCLHTSHILFRHNLSDFVLILKWILVPQFQYPAMWKFW